jgi:hypothetical protein
MILGGLLPFSAIYIELYYIYEAIWGYANYTLYGILLVVFIILLLVTACMNIALTYFQLSIEDSRWWWRSFLSGGYAPPKTTPTGILTTMRVYRALTVL